MKQQGRNTEVPATQRRGGLVHAFAMMNPSVFASGSKSRRCRSSNVALTVRTWRKSPSAAVRAGARRLG